MARKKKQPEASPVTEATELVNTEQATLAPLGLPNVSEAVQAQQPSLPAQQASNLPATSAGGHAVERAVPPIEFSALVRERRHLLRFVVVVLLLCAALIASVFIMLYRPTAYAQRTGSVLFMYHEGSNTTTVSYNGEVVADGVPGHCVSYMYDETGRACAALLDQTLYLIGRDEMREVGSGVADFLLSQNGAVLVYRTAENVLYYCPVEKELSPSRISGDTRDASYCLSPDGKELFYTYTQEDVTRIDVYSATNSKPLFSKVTGILPVAVGNGCEFLYYKNAETGELFYYEQDVGTPVLCYKGAAVYAFNRDFSELMLHGETGTQIWCRGERLLIPSLATGEFLFFLQNQCAETRELEAGVQYLVKSFKKGYYLKYNNTEDGIPLMYLNKKGDLTLVQHIGAETPDPVVTDKAVYFLVVEKRSETEVLRHLYRCEIGKTEPERISWDVDEFCVNSDGSRIMYTDKHGALYAMRIGEADPVRHADNIDEKGTLCVTYEDVFYYYTEETLYVSDNGETPRAAHTNADAVAIDAHTAYFLVEAEDGTYTVLANHRNRRRDTQLASGVTQID